MHQLSREDRTAREAGQIEQFAAEFQRDLWAYIDHVNERMSRDGRWTHDDNMAVQHLGWALYKVEGERYVLITLNRKLSYEETIRRIRHMAVLCPLHQKALAILAAQTLKGG